MIELITGYAGEAHVSAADAGRFNAGVCGMGKYVLNTGMFPVSVLSNTIVRIGPGDAVDQGRHILIPQGSYEDVTIDGGTAGKSRVDVIALQYQRDNSTGIESASVVVVKGTIVNVTPTPPIPSVPTGNIFNGATLDAMPLYYVYLEGTAITLVRPAYTVIPPLSDMLNKVYPVGSIYISTVGTSPADLFGGTWQEITGKFLFARSTSHGAGTEGGSETVTLTEAQLPAHTHTGPSHTHTVAAHTHTASSGSAGAHSHTVARNKISASGTARYAAQADNVDHTTHSTSSAGAHSHTITVASGGGGSTGAAGTGATGSTGSGSAITIMPPYLAVYIWKRTA